MSEKTKDVIKRLEILASIKSGDKLCVKSKFCVSKKSLYGAILRYMSLETRQTTIDELKSLVPKCQKHLRSLDINELFPFHGILMKCISGIKNLCITYEDDISMVLNLTKCISEFNTLIELVNLRIDVLNLERNRKHEFIHKEQQIYKETEELKSTEEYHSATNSTIINDF